MYYDYFRDFLPLNSFYLTIEITPDSYELHHQRIPDHGQGCILPLQHPRDRLSKKERAGESRPAR
jgi:hypothetical protein